jgi:hypothetical protein
MSGDRFMDILDQKTDDELLRSLIAELAKTSNELRCAKQDLEKVTGRLSFALAVTNKLINRQGD